METIFVVLSIHKPSLGSSEVPQKKLCPIGLAILTFIGYKQTDKQSINILGFKAALSPSTNLTFNCGSICEHLIFVQYKSKRKNVRGFSNIFSCVFKSSWKLKAFLYNSLRLWASINLPLGHKICARLVQLFWRLLNTNRQTNRHTTKVCIYRRKSEFFVFKTVFYYF